MHTFRGVVLFKEKDKDKVEVELVISYEVP